MAVRVIADAAIKTHPEYESLVPYSSLAAAYYAGQNYAKTGAKTARVKQTYSQKQEEKAVSSLGKALGVDVVFSNDLGEANGYFKDGKIYISRTAENHATVVFSHEITHRMQEASPELYNEFKDKVVKISRTGRQAGLKRKN